LTLPQELHGSLTKWHLKAKYLLNHLEVRLYAYTFALLIKQHKAMKNSELVKTETGSKTTAVIAQNSAKAEKLIKKAEEVKAVDKKATDKPKKEPKVHAESNEALGMRLLKEGASQKQIIAAFTEVYKAKKGVTDEKFVAARAAIYMKIAATRAAAKDKR
jgi:hypothetical protein